MVESDPVSGYMRPTLTSFGETPGPLQDAADVAESALQPTSADRHSSATGNADSARIDTWRPFPERCCGVVDIVAGKEQLA